MEALLEVSHLTRRFGDRIAVRDLSFRLEGRGAVGLLGANGAGKTTTLRLIAGYLAPHGGTARVAGFDILAEPREVRRRIGYLAEGAPAPAEMRVEAYLAFRAHLKGLGARTPGEVERVLARCGLKGERRAVIAQLSRGYRQRVGLADALLGEPPLLLLDEPASGLDPAQIRDLRDLLRDLARERAILLSSHALSEVEALCGRVLVLARGEIVADGAPDAVRVRGGSPVRLRVAVRGDAGRARAVLASVPGLGPPEVLPSSDGALHLVAALSEGDPRAAAARALCDAGLDLLELRLEAPSLEDAFVALASEDAR
jgi:ABC-2 type transport system ATP-binding protein